MNATETTPPSNCNAPPRVKLTVALEGAVHAGIQRVAAEERRSLNQEINHALAQHIQRHDQRKELKQVENLERRRPTF